MRFAWGRVAPRVAAFSPKVQCRTRAEAVIALGDRRDLYTSKNGKKGEKVEKGLLMYVASVCLKRVGLARSRGRDLSTG